MPVDVVIVGAGAAGLAAAIRLKQLDNALEVAVLEKGAESARISFRARWSIRARWMNCCPNGATRAARWRQRR